MDKFTVDGPAAAANLRFERDRGADRRGRPGRARGARAGPGQPRPGRARGPSRPRRGAEWEAAAAAVLRKARRLTDDDADAQVWDKLTLTTLDGIGITPLGTPDLLDGLVTAGRPTRPGAWDIRAHLAVTDAKTDNETLLTDLEGGVTSLWLEADEDTDWQVLLDQVLLDLAPVVLQTTDGRRPRVPAVRRRPRAPRRDQPRPRRPAPRTRGAGRARPGRRGIRAFVVDATEVHDRGASDVQELAHSLAVGRDVPAHPDRRRLRPRRGRQDRRVPLRRHRRAVHDHRQAPGRAPAVGAGARAQRRPADHEQHQHAVTSRPMMSKYDPWVNMLRTTVAAFAAGVGGADAVTVLPFDSPLGHARRVRPPDRAQHLPPADRRVARRHRRRPGRWCLRRREAHRRPRRRCLGAVRPARGRPGPGRRDREDRRASATARSRPASGR